MTTSFLIKPRPLSSIVRVSTFSFTRKKGGTGQSTGTLDPKFTGFASVSVVRGWYDEETGYCFQVKAASNDMVEYLRQHGAGSDQVYISQFHLINPADLEEMKAFCGL
ncbi:hypothetical protein [Pseudomonas sp. UBA7530]|uniref:hypothetical protein n=1 Tax=Pseudomonas sp. UBA7530 TaxID=1947341 RepID=UPI0025DD3318|nr:hypothetical protein [Pseudomonas sp. UBA7530]